MEDTKYSQAFTEKINTDYILQGNPGKSFDFSPFDSMEIQYLRELVVSDKRVNDYENNRKVLTEDNQSMHEFTENIIRKIDSFK